LPWARCGAENERGVSRVKTTEARLVSVMVPAYNAEATVEETLTSVANQTHRPIEVVIVDDGSTDRTAAIVDEFCTRMSAADFRVIVRHQPNQGLLESRNVGLQASTGHYLQFLDADDVLHPEKLARCVEAFDSGNWDVVVARTEEFRSQAAELSHPGELWVRPWTRRERWMATTTSGLWYTMGPVFSRSVVLSVGAFPPNVHPVVEELEFHGRIKLATRRICHLPWVLNWRRVGNPMSVTGERRRLYKGRLEGARIVAQMLGDRGITSVREWASLFRMSLKTYSQTLNGGTERDLVDEARESWLSVAASRNRGVSTACVVMPRKWVEAGLRATFELRHWRRGSLPTPNVRRD